MSNFSESDTKTDSSDSDDGDHRFHELTKLDDSDEPDIERDADEPEHEYEPEPFEQEPDHADERYPELIDPAPETNDFTVRVEDHEVEVEVDNEPETPSNTAIEDMTANEIQRFQRVFAEEAARRGAIEARPFEHVDLESLLVLSNQIRAELAYR